MTQREQDLIDAGLWKVYKHLGANLDVDQIPEEALASFLMEIIPLAQVPMCQVVHRIRKIRKFRQALKHLQSLPQVAQRSPEWYELRRNRLTASDMAQAMGRGKFGNRAQLVKKKAYPEDTTFNLHSEPLRWGVMFEPIASRSYSQRLNDMDIHEFGCIPHADISCFGASPDGITEMGIMVEFKCPWRRKIDGNVLEQYEIQMQGQMAVCGLEECHFVECDIQKLESREEYIGCIDECATVDHGIVLEYTNADEQFRYSPPYLTTKQALEWMTEQPRDGKVVFWKLRKYHMCCVRFDEERWETMVPSILDFWRDVESLRARPKEKAKTLDFVDDDDDEDIGCQMKEKEPKTTLNFVVDDDDISN